MDIRWTKRHAFAEVAEVLGINTDMVIGRLDERDLTTVLYSKHYDSDAGDHDVYAALLKRDPAGLLHVVGERHIPGMWEEIRANVERALADDDDHIFTDEEGNDR